MNVYVIVVSILIQELNYVLLVIQVVRHVELLQHNVPHVLNQKFYIIINVLIFVLPDTMLILQLIHVLFALLIALHVILELIV